MIWRGKNLRTVRDLMDAMSGLKDETEARDFMSAYRKSDPAVADVNIGYLTGYFQADDMVRLQKWCGVRHPIFGSSVPTQAEALGAGILMGTEKREGEEPH